MGKIDERQASTTSAGLTGEESKTVDPNLVTETEKEKTSDEREGSTTPAGKE